MNRLAGLLGSAALAFGLTVGPALSETYSP